VSFARHADLSVKSTADYRFAAHVNSVPLVASEIVPASAEYPVVFTVTPDGAVPVAVLGLQEGVNLFVGEDGRWLGGYVPAFLRRYPFVFSTADGGERLTLCIDESYAGCNREDRGERLFDADGEHTLRLKSVLEFLKQYQAEFERTRQFSANLQALRVFEPMNASFRLPDGREGTLGGFSGIDRARLRAVGAEALDRLARTDELELAYLQMNSLRHFQALVDRAAKRVADASGAGNPTDGQASEPGADERANPDETRH
ncbi:MAG: hypothetical protein RIS35_561, partial [Pseudomonadota bacterium]